MWIAGETPRAGDSSELGMLEEQDKKGREVGVRGESRRWEMRREVTEGASCRPDFLDHRFYSKKDGRHWRLLFRFTF